jgi:predicted ATPase/DNA-binding SARP family transcriptional activator
MNPKKLTVRLFGGVELKLDEQAIDDLPTRKAEALLAYLACQKRPIARETLAELLWDERSQDQALANLRSILSSLRRSLDAHFEVTRQTVSFNRASHFWLDVDEFERLAKTLTQREDGDPRARMATLQAAIDLYRGDFLEGFYLRESLGFEEWAILERERWQRTAVTLLWQALDLTTTAGDYAAALRYADKLLRFDNLSERAHRAKMLILARLGQFNAALQHFDSLGRLLDDELGVEPAAETTTLHAQIKLAREIAPPSLPPPPPHFVGRGEDEATLAAHLRDPARRLVTVLGASGMGKTRLAVETVRRLAAAHPGQFLHGIYFLPLADISDVGLFAPTLAAALGIALNGPEDPKERITDFLKTREVLLVLDNFEQLVDEADWLGDLLAAARQVKILVTSQEALHLQEEWILDLRGLSTPPTAGDDIAPEAYSAVQLFLQIAQRLSPRYQATTAEIHAIGQIGRMVEGMPLGIELAAAWVRQFSAGQIAEEIARGLDILTTQMRNLPSRHRSLRAAFDYAWRLLPAASQDVFARLAAFHGGFAADAAAAIAGATPSQLALLVEKSLLRLEDGRYTMHPLLSRFAAEKLETQADAANVHAAHATFYLDFVAGQGDGESPAQRQAISGEMANVRAAWLWAAAQQRHETILKVATTLHNFYSAQSWFRQGIDAFYAALAALSTADADASVTAQTRCELLIRAGRMQIHIGQLEAAKRALDEALRYAGLIEDSTRLSTILGYSAITAFYTGDLARAVSLAEEGLALDESTGDLGGVAFALNFLGSCHKSRGDYTAAADYFSRAVTIYAELNDDLGRAMSLNNLGNLAQAQGEYAAAHEYYLLCSRLFREQNHVHGAATTLANAGRLSRKLGNLEEAEALLRESMQLKEEIHDQRGVAVALIGLSDVALAHENPEDARSFLAQALTLARIVGDVKLMLEAIAGYGALRLSESEDRLPAARLLAFVSTQAALAQEVRDQVEALRVDLTAGVWRQATAWAENQLLPALVDDLLSEK